MHDAEPQKTLGDLLVELELLDPNASALLQGDIQGLWEAAAVHAGGDAKPVAEAVAKALGLKAAFEIEMQPGLSVAPELTAEGSMLPFRLENTEGAPARLWVAVADPTRAELRVRLEAAYPQTELNWVVTPFDRLQVWIRACRGESAPPMYFQGAATELSGVPIHGGPVRDGPVRESQVAVPTEVVRKRRPPTRQDTLRTLRSFEEGWLVHLARSFHAIPLLMQLLIGLGLVAIGVMLVLAQRNSERVPSVRLQERSPSTSAFSRGEPIAPGLFDRPRSPAHRFVREADLPMQLRAEPVSRELELLRLGEEVELLRRDGDWALILTRPGGPAGYVPQSGLTEERPLKSLAYALRFEGCRQAGCKARLEPQRERCHAACRPGTRCAAACDLAYSDCRKICDEL